MDLGKLQRGEPFLLKLHRLMRFPGVNGGRSDGRQGGQTIKEKQHGF
jgi:hypothetical protein